MNFLLDRSRWDGEGDGDDSGSKEKLALEARKQRCLGTTYRTTADCRLSVFCRLNRALGLGAYPQRLAGSHSLFI